jgi:N-acetyl-anhydromuramyl-L-alanine amidase AmpD
MRNINKVIVHCSDSDVDSHDNVETIRGWHIKERGFSDIGYHYIITRDGAIWKGRPVEDVGAHCRGHNEDSIGVCLTGKHQFTARQYASLRSFLGTLGQLYKLEKSDMYGHRDFSAKSCPNFDVQEIIK